MYEIFLFINTDTEHTQTQHHNHIYKYIYRVNKSDEINNQNTKNYKLFY